VNRNEASDSAGISGTIQLRLSMLVSIGRT
jgi:hypothetical protein